MKRPCQIDFDTQGDDYFSMVSSIWQIKTNNRHMKTIIVSLFKAIRN
ncbi:hypothetical protein [Labilibaculum manganireducens]|nr:hypothetical protein [Labilibaculum manganireducens]